MKLSVIYQAFAIVSFSTSGLAALLFDPLPTKLASGDEVKLNWTADHDYVSIKIESHNQVTPEEANGCTDEWMYRL